MQDLFSRLPFVKASAEATEDDVRKKNPFPTGPRAMRTMTNGQVRRMYKREDVANAQRNNKAQRRNFFAQRRAVAVLRGQLIVLNTPEAFPIAQVNGVRDALFADFLKRRPDLLTEERDDQIHLFASTLEQLKLSFAEDLEASAERVAA